MLTERVRVLTQALCKILIERVRATVFIKVLCPAAENDPKILPLLAPSLLGNQTETLATQARHLFQTDIRI